MSSAVLRGRRAVAAAAAAWPSATACRARRASTLVPILSRATRNRDSLAVVTAGGDEHTYGDLLRAADGLAGALEGAGGATLDEGRVAFMCPPGPAYVASMWATWAAGGVAVPLHPGHPSVELEFVLDNSRPTTVLCHTSQLDRVEPIARGLGLACVEVTDADADGRAATSSPSSSALPGRFDSASAAWDDDGAAAVWRASSAAGRRALFIYTSGTTGRPKGAVHTHGGVTAQLESLTAVWEYAPTDRILHFLPLHHTHGIVNKLLCPLWAGGCVEFAPDAKAETLVGILAGLEARPASDRLTMFMAVPTIYALMARHLREGCDDATREAAVAGMQRLRLMVSGSAACPVPLMNEWEDITGHRLLERYGMTEIGMALSNSLRGPRHPGYVGLPLPGVSARLVDEDSGSVLLRVGGDGAVDPADLSGSSEVQGLLEIAGPTVFKEYWANPEATQKEFTDDGWFKTGDVAAFSAVPGAIRICGRASVDIIKSGGYKVSALEVERALLTSPLVEQAAVLGVDDPVWGEKIGAIVVLSSEGGALGADAALGEIKAWMGEEMAGYKVPRAWLLQNEIPKNAMGKVNKKALKPLFG